MQRAFAFGSPGSAEPDANTTFNVVIAYEDFETGKHAKKTYDFLAQNLGDDCQFSNQMWKFDVLSIPKLREMAALDAAGADIVIVSCHGSDLPAEVKAWIESWLSHQGRPLALVALFDCPEEQIEGTRAAHDYLAAVAQRGQMEFFAQLDDWPARRHVEGPLVFTHDLTSERALSALAGVVQRDTPFPRWGINE